MKTVRLGLCMASALVGATIAGLPMTGAAAADVGWVRPAHAPLLDAEGNDSGCVANDPKMYVRQNSKGEYRLGDSTTLLCDRAYGKQVWSIGMWEIMPDGTRVLLYPMNETLRGSGPDAGVFLYARSDRPCDLVGTHTYLTRAKIKVKVDFASTNPYSAIVERVSTVSCPS